MVQNVEKLLLYLWIANTVCAICQILVSLDTGTMPFTPYCDFSDLQGNEIVNLSCVLGPEELIRELPVIFLVISHTDFLVGTDGNFI